MPAAHALRLFLLSRSRSLALSLFCSLACFLGSPGNFSHHIFSVERNLTLCVSFVLCVFRSCFVCFSVCVVCIVRCRVLIPRTPRQQRVLQGRLRVPSAQAQGDASVRLYTRLFLRTHFTRLSFHILCHCIRIIRILCHCIRPIRILCFSILCIRIL